MRTNVVSIVLLLALLVGLTGCGGGSGSSNGGAPYTPPDAPAFTPVAKFTTSELTANNIYAAAANTTGFITAYTFSPNGKVTEYINMTTTNTSSASEILAGTYYIDNSGVIAINIPFKPTEKIWKKTSTADEYDSYNVESNYSSVTGRWFFDEVLGASQALAFAQGKPIPTQIWTAVNSPATEYLQGVVWSGTQYVAVGDNGTVLTSVDGSLWAAATSGSTESLQSIAWSGTKYVVVGGWNGNILTSLDGTTWSKTATGINQFLRKVIWGNNQLVAVGGSGTILTSPNGINWTQRITGTTNEISNVVWTGTKFVAVGGSNGTVCLTSADGITWALENGLPAVYNGMLFGLAWNGSNLVTSGWAGTIATSTDGGSTWAKSTYGTNNLYAIVWTNNNFITVGANGTIITSPDGTTWATDTSPSTSNLSDIACSSSACVAVGGTLNVSTILLYQ